MKRIIILILNFFLFISANASMNKIGNLAGKIIDHNTQKPIENVMISIDGKPMGYCNKAGKFLIKGISSGSHQITFSRIGYEPRTKVNVVIKPNQTTVQNIEMKPQSVVIEGITVREETFFQESDDAPVSSNTLDIEEIRSQPSGAYDIQRAIQAIPAIVSATDADNEIIVRGGNYGENLFVLDNIELQNPNHFAWPGTGGGPVSMITPEFVKKIDFYAGAFPAKYGDKASSVLDIITRDGNENRFEAKFDVGMAGYGGNIEGPIFPGKGNFIVSYHRSFLSLISDDIGLAAVPNYHSVFAKQVFNFSPYKKLIIDQLWGNDWIEVKHEKKSGYTAAAGGDDVYAHSGQFTIGATYKSIYQNSYSLLTLFRNFNWWKHELYEAGTKTEESKTWSQNTYEAHNKIKFSVIFPETPLGKLESGGYFNFDEFYTDKFMRPDTVFVYAVGTEIIVDTLKDENGNPIIYALDEDNKIKEKIFPKKYGGYIQEEKQFGRITVNAGIRYDYLDYSHESSVAPRVGGKYSISQTSHLSLGAGRQFQNPDYYMFTANESNKNLKPKYTDQIVLGIDKLLAEDIKASVETYYKKYFDVPLNISSTTTDSVDWSSQKINAGKGYAKGIEFFLQKKVKDNFWGTISYSYSVAKAYDPRDPTEKTEYNWDFDYRHVFTGIIGCRLEFQHYDWYDKWRKWFKFIGWLGIIPADETEISLKFRYLGGKPFTKLTYVPELRRWLLSGNQPINTERFPPYRRLDLHVQHRWFENKFNIISYLEIDNVLNTKNVWDYNYLEDGSRETIYQWGRMVVGGVMIEF